MTRRVYADHAATTPIDPVALDAMIELQRETFGNPSQPHAYGRAARAKLEEARATIARCVNAQPDEIYFTSGATEGNNWVIKGHCDHAREQFYTPFVGISAIEHDSVRRAFDAAYQESKKITDKGVEWYDFFEGVFPCDRNGLLDVSDYADFMSNDERDYGEGALISVMLANNEIGVIQDIPSLRSGFFGPSALNIHTDATQAVGHIPVDVRELRVNALTASAHKFNGPKGVGFLYLEKADKWVDGDLVLPQDPLCDCCNNLLDGGGQEFGRRSGTPNVPGIVGMAIALERNVARMAENTAKLKALEERLLGRLDAAGVDYVRNAPDAPKLPGFLSLAFPGHSAERLFHRLDLWGVAVSTGSACHGQSTEVSRVLKAIGLPDELAKATLRITLGKENTEEDVDYIADCLAKLTKEKK